MSYFIFNGICSNDKGIIVTKMPPIPKPKKKINSISIPGKNGVLYQDEDAYEPIVIQIQCALIDEDVNLKDIRNWLNGEGELVLSNNPTCFYNANIINQIDYTNIANRIHEFPLEIELYPICYSIEEKEFNINQKCEITITESTYPIKPYIKIFGNGNVTLTINNNSIIIKNINEYIELNCEDEEAYKGSENMNGNINCEEFPIFVLGKNSIEFIGDVTKIQFIYREAYI